ncbi:glycine/D-amino acid oxidase-like deaminating enzyme [Yoonia maricola]|uniref:Glycine/D-amino acid oxidase-like deaminating enzyme n=1 Tax=Yoonia maricola TaxID=420999 RepID=A0A2M8W2Y9_9RHOB|nr:FAD-binding oxidoreductase [Yoonia maricola]PJI85287.1 glycine/D-amino acid oxidase-like deaminating enzyme [Yoonia maricola]
MIDFLIIGGGIAGVSAAARLSQLGSVTLLEGEDALAYHASGRSAAMFEQNYGKPSTVMLNKASQAFHEKADVLSPRGLMLIGTAATADAFDADQKDMQLDPISLQDARDMLPILDTGLVDRAAYHASAWDIDTDKLIQTFARSARANGATIHTKTCVDGIRRINTGWVVSAGDTEFKVRNLVNAAGGWVDPIAEMAGIAPLGFTPLRRSMARIPAPGAHNVSIWPMLFGPGENWYAKPDAGALIVSPAEEDPTTPHDAYADDIVLAEGLARYEAHVTEPVTRLLSSWAGLRTFSPDRTLVLGPDPRDPSFIWCAGQGGYGMQSAPGASQLLADLVSGARSELPEDTIAALSPQRFA